MKFTVNNHFPRLLLYGGEIHACYLFLTRGALMGEGDIGICHSLIVTILDN